LHDAHVEPRINARLTSSIFTATLERRCDGFGDLVGGT
jgi:hypothetical protein